MSVASEIEQLATNLSNIKTAITAKGGTVAEGAGFDDIATAVGTISGGGPTPTPDPVSDYGVLRFFDYTTELGELRGMGMGMSSIYFTKTAIVDMEKLETFCEENDMIFDLYDSNVPHIFIGGRQDSLYLQYNDWQRGIDVNKSYSSLADLEEETGIRIALSSYDVDISVEIGLTVKLNRSGPTTDLTLTNSSDMAQLYPDTSSGSDLIYRYIINGVSYPACAIKAFYFGTQSCSLPSNHPFLAYCDNLEYVSQFPSWMAGKTLPTSSFAEDYSLKKIALPDSGNVGAGTNGQTMWNLVSLEELYVGSSTPMPSMVSYGADPLCGYSLAQIDQQGMRDRINIGRPIRITGANRAAWVESWGEVYNSGEYYRYVVNGGE